MGISDLVNSSEYFSWYKVSGYDKKAPLFINVLENWAVSPSSPDQPSCQVSGQDAIKQYPSNGYVNHQGWTNNLAVTWMYIYAPRCVPGHPHLLSQGLIFHPAAAFWESAACDVSAFNSTLWVSSSRTSSGPLMSYWMKYSKQLNQGTSHAAVSQRAAVLM